MSWFPEQNKLQGPPTGDCLWCGGNTYEGFKCKICSPTKKEEDTKYKFVKGEDGFLVATLEKDMDVKKAESITFENAQHFTVENSDFMYSYKLDTDWDISTATLVREPEPVEKEEDIVNKPAHYNHNETGIECIDAIRAATGEHYEGYLQGNIIKYIWRYRYKNKVEDLQKAQVYTKWLEDHLKEKM